MNKVLISPNLFIPMPVVLVGTERDGRANFMTAGWCSRANANPPMILCGISRGHWTNDAIRENKTFSINIPPSSLLVETDYCGLVSGKNKDKSSVFRLFTGELKGAPMIEECSLTMECRLEHTLDLPTNTIFVGDICAAYANPGVIKNERPDFSKVDPLILTMPDNTYWRLGAAAGKAWSAGRVHKGYTS